MRWAAASPTNLLYHSDPKSPFIFEPTFTSAPINLHFRDALIVVNVT